VAAVYLAAGIMSAALAVALVGCGGGDEGAIRPRHYMLGERVDVEGYPDLVVERFTRSTDPNDVAGDFTFFEVDGYDVLIVRGLSFELEPGDELLVATVRIINDTGAPAGINSAFDLALLSRNRDMSDALDHRIAVERASQTEMLPAGGEWSGRIFWSARRGFDRLALQYTPGSRKLLTEPFETIGELEEAFAGRYVVDLEPE
jgi:hypothetical protein